MPPHRKNRRKLRKKKTSKKWAKRSMGVKPYKSLGNGLPDQVNMTIKYHQSYHLAGNSGLRYILLSMNEPVIPQVFPTSSSDGANIDAHSSMYLEEMSKVYQRFRVNNTLVVAKCCGNSTNVAGGVGPSNQSHGIKIYTFTTNDFSALTGGASTNPASIIERPGCKSRIISDVQGVVSLKSWYKKGRNNPNAGDTDIGDLSQTPYTTLVSNQTWLYIIVSAINPNAGFDIDIDVNMYFNTNFFKRKAPALSDFDEAPLGGNM